MAGVTELHAEGKRMKNNRKTGMMIFFIKSFLLEF